MQDNPALTCENKDNLLAMFVMALIQGETLAAKMIKAQTMRNYLSAFIKLFQLRKLPDPTKQVTTSNAWKAIDIYEKWQKMSKH